MKQISILMTTREAITLLDFCLTARLDCGDKREAVRTVEDKLAAAVDRKRAP